MAPSANLPTVRDIPVDTSSSNHHQKEPSLDVKPIETTRTSPKPQENASSPDHVLLPDLFVSFLSRKPRPHPLYQEIKKESEDFFKETLQWSEKAHKRLCHGDFAYFSAIFCPTASRSNYRLITDWCNWVFPFDDQFDEDGPLRGNMTLARAELDATYSIMTDTPVPFTRTSHPLRWIFKSCWERVCACASPAVQARFRAGMHLYLTGVLKQVAAEQDSVSPETIISTTSPYTFLDARRESIGTYPLYPLIELSLNLSLPSDILAHPSLQTLHSLTADIVVLQNEILSYQKEFFNGDPRNLIALLRLSPDYKMGQEAAYGFANELLKEAYRGWFHAKAELPMVDEEMDEAVSRYVEILEELCRANLCWSFATRRYFGEERERVRDTRLVRKLEY